MMKNLLDIIKYIIPVVSNENSEKKVKDSLLEEFIVDLITKNNFNKKEINKSKNKKTIKKQISGGVSLEETLAIVDDKKGRKNVDYSLKVERKRESEDNYSVTIKYEDNGEEEKLDVEVKDDSKPDEVYVFSLIREKPKKEHGKSHSVSINYRTDYEKEKITIHYNEPLFNYKEKKEIAKQDFSNLASNKWVDVFPESQMGGILGFTYLGDNYQALRADMLYSPLGKMVDLHEAIHTPDEHETRVLTSWMMDIKKPVYKK